MITILLVSLLPRGGTAEAVDFTRDIRPLLSDTCFTCHGPDAAKRKAGLRLDTRDGLFAHRDRSSIVVPHSPEKSELFRRVISENGSERMPPSGHLKSLDASQIDLIRRWIEQGAEWKDHWAYQTLAPWTDSQDDSHVIDRYWRRTWSDVGVKPAELADPITLLRRVTFDLTGLPPSRAALACFERSPTTEAYVEYVDQLLTSSHYAERMAMHWLDLVRYADTVGYHGDQEHPISPYRDYVIHAFLTNKPFDQFTVEQLAGDLLPSPTEEMLIATGYNRVLQTTHEGGAQDGEYLVKYAADRVRNVSTVWLGTTMGCAECHDHKFDPISTADFYRLSAFFADIKEKGFFDSPNTSPTKRPPEKDVLSPLDQMKIATKRAEYDQHVREGSPAPILASLRRSIDTMSQKRRTMITESVPPRDIRILPRGDWLDRSGPVVQPAIPAHFGILEEPARENRRATRLDLARWLVSKKNPLGARVFVNRLWFLFFGEGLSKVLDDLGSQGDVPRHGSLLDRLADEFIQSGYDVKHMIRLLVTSKAYRLSSHATPERTQQDPQNEHFGRQNRFRLPAEMIRDQALAISGLLVHELGGESSRPYQPKGYYLHLNFPKRSYKPDEDKSQYRRGVYMHWQRQFLHPMLLAFDAPTREECTAQRVTSNTPAAALALLNDPTFVEASRAFAIRILREGGVGLSDRMTWSVREALGRAPTELEREALSTLFIEHRADWARRPDDLKKFLSVGMQPLPDDLDPIDVGAYASVARVLFNLHEFVNRD